MTENERLLSLQLVEQIAVKDRLTEHLCALEWFRVAFETAEKAAGVEVPRPSWVITQMDRWRSICGEVGLDNV